MPGWDGWSGAGARGDYAEEAGWHSRAAIAAIDGRLFRSPAADGRLEEFYRANHSGRNRRAAAGAPPALEGGSEARLRRHAACPAGAPERRDRPVSRIHRNGTHGRAKASA